MVGSAVPKTSPCSPATWTKSLLPRVASVRSERLRPPGPRPHLLRGSRWPAPGRLGGKGPPGPAWQGVGGRVPAEAAGVLRGGPRVTVGPADTPRCAADTEALAGCGGGTGPSSESGRWAGPRQVKAAAKATRTLMGGASEGAPPPHPTPPGTAAAWPWPSRCPHPQGTPASSSSRPPVWPLRAFALPAAGARPLRPVCLSLC